jgi:hypothetical protein
LLIAREADADAKQDIAVWLSRWRDNQTKLQPLEKQSFLMQEVVPLSQDLSAVALTGIEALDYFNRGERPPDSWTTEQFALLVQAQKPKGQLLLIIVPAVRELVEASSGQKAPVPQK